MPSEAQRQASRANGALSKGPVTEAGKARSCLNNYKDGFYARQLTLMPDDDPAFWETVLDDHDRSFEPADPIEAQLVRKMAEGVFLIERWERRRAEVELRAFTGPAGPGGPAGCPDTMRAFESYGRWIERQSRANDRLHRQFLRHRKARRAGMLAAALAPVPANDDRAPTERLEPGLALMLLNALLALDAEGEAAQRAWVRALPIAERQGLRQVLVEAGRPHNSSAAVNRACLMWSALEEHEWAHLTEIKEAEGW